MPIFFGNWFFGYISAQFSYNCGNTEELKTHAYQPKHIDSRQPGTL